MPTNLYHVASAAAALVGTASAFVRHHAPLPAVAPASRRGRTVMSMRTGIFYASISGSAEELADRLKDELGDDAHGPFDVSDEDDFSVADLMSYDSIICGLPTYNTGNRTPQHPGPTDRPTAPVRPARPRTPTRPRPHAHAPTPLLPTRSLLTQYHLAYSSLPSALN